ncbi:MAG: thioredoxin-disulfide reductase [Lachnospiraceae bacterium]|nr:thioredoxin-disulfide reductase [Lachnospiraceae bacterium]
MEDLIILGGGPAGLSAGVYGVRAGLKTLLIEKSAMSGGQVLTTYEVDNYLGMKGMNGFDMGMKFKEHAEAMGVNFKEAEVTGIEDMGDRKLVHTDQGDLETKTLLLASGASHSKLHVPGEEELAGMGVSYCATCDGAFFKNKVTAVVGGGDVAVEDAIFLARFCQKVYLIHRRNELRAAKILQDELLSLPNVEVLWDQVVTQIKGEEQVESAMLRNVKTDVTQELSLQGIFIAVGIEPNTEYVPDQIQQDEKGYIIAGEDCCTNVAGIYAAGDVRTKALRQIVTAVADGANAVTSVQKYLLESKATK